MLKHITSKIAVFSLSLSLCVCVCVCVGNPYSGHSDMVPAGPNSTAQSSLSPQVCTEEPPSCSSWWGRHVRWLHWLWFGIHEVSLQCYSRWENFKHTFLRNLRYFFCSRHTTITTRPFLIRLINKSTTFKSWGENIEDIIILPLFLANPFLFMLLSQWINAHTHTCTHTHTHTNMNMNVHMHTHTHTHINTIFFKCHSFF